MTIYALSYWLAAALVAGVGGQAAYTKPQIESDWHRLLSVVTALDADTMAARAIRRGALVA